MLKTQAKIIFKLMVFVVKFKARYYLDDKKRRKLKGKFDLKYANKKHKIL